MKPEPPTVLAYVGTEGDYQPVLEHASDAARKSGGRLILYDIDAASSLASPRPTVWSSDGADRPFEEGILTPEMLRATGQIELADLVEDCRQEGIDAFGWLPVNARTVAVVAADGTVELH